jgi:hypothetical protein
VKILLKYDEVSLTEFAKLGAIGFAFSFGLLFVGLAILMAIIAVFTLQFSNVFYALGMLLIAPLVIGFNGAVFGIIVFFGLKVFCRFKKLASVL